MFPHWSSVIVVLLPLAWSTAVHGFSCKFCQSANNYSSCIATAGEVECTVALVNMTHLLLQPHNPSLAKQAAPSASQFQCFQVNYTTAGVWNYHMGCTFAGSNICAGWKVLSQCKVAGGSDRRQPANGKASDGPTSNRPAPLITPTPTSKGSGGSGSTSSVKSNSSTTVGANSSTVLSTVMPKRTSNGSIAQKAASKAAVSLSQAELLLVVWLVVPLWNHR
ncbi:uncharacterized protein LOC120898438 isoform X1 [Anopheles arabiensis]|uniref:uncharacterized protein LOC120898438 isoform X1 n=1 Tax=Anopheles arabiensis TaxID=7173 RepID=UPI001AADB2D0|nr:uncharacterized protein LOC120898438 isoform X1 [Anopheles arabiensis]